MGWEIEYTDRFGAWFHSLDDEAKEAIAVSIDRLEEFGPFLSRPHADTLNGSRHANMKELRTNAGGRPFRTFCAFDPRKAGILLIGGDKGGDSRFYSRMIPLADDLYDEYLEELRREGII